ncbi:ANTAR domain-containing protein [Streptomyces chiangmaiensis]|uniref:ANTAR domain-containing protein n=1 Tax=Streptomyces chiangmaiensis TaxID=766497 RepID=A0ABU7FTI0_9ACTN|nr:ANTAR domain-containing protein [Streptomyces chiangmaiensis]MED7827278.1 ANTAR domain-containing protein [Streptomyces chiangmaiensis]
MDDAAEAPFHSALECEQALNGCASLLPLVALGVRVKEHPDVPGNKTGRTDQVRTAPYIGGNVDSHSHKLHGAVQEPAGHPDEIQQLQTKVAQLERAVSSHTVIDQAIGVVVAVGRMTPAESWGLLRETSMCTNTKLRHVAELVVTLGVTGNLTADIREELARRLSSAG